MAGTDAAQDDISIASPPPSLRSVTSREPLYTSVAADDFELTGHVEPIKRRRSLSRHSVWAQHSSDLSPRDFLTSIKEYVKQTPHPREYWPIVKERWKSSPPARETWATVVQDVKSVPCIWLLRRFVALLLPLLVISGLIVLLTFMSKPGFIYDRGSVCKPDGTFELSFKDYSPWKREAIFAINMGYGSFSFGVAKLIDVLWDVGIGRGGQALVAVFTYQAFTKALSRTMENTAVSHDTFKAVTLQNDTISGVLILSKDFFRTGGARARWAMLWTILAGLFVLAIPTWSSAMTGYTADISAFVEDNNRNLVPSEDYRPVIYTIHDGDRLGEPYTKDYQVVLPWYNDEVSMDWSNTYDCTYAYFSSYGTDKYSWRELSNVNCTLMWRLSEYVFNYGFLGLNTTESRFFFPNDTGSNNSLTLTAPNLNISANILIYSESYMLDGNGSYYPWYEIPWAAGWKNPITNNHTFNVSNPLLYDDGSGTTYNLTQFNERGSCQQLGLVKYKWGFSFLLLYIFVATWLAWTIGMYAFYLDTYFNSRLDIVGRRMGIERAVVDISEAMQKRLDLDQVDLADNPTIQSQVKGGQISYKELPLDYSVVTRATKLRIWWRDFKLWPWIRSETWWMGLFLLFSLLFLLSLKSIRRNWSPRFSIFPVVGILIVFAVRERIQNRWLIFTMWFILCCVCNIIW